jgi:CxxC-x17-CxxC domain-containing protein
MEFQDKTLQCVDCSGEFVFSAAEQAFFFEKQFKNEPKRCRACKAKRVAATGGNVRQITRKVETAAVCSICGKETTVPFRPTQGRPVLCRECFTQAAHQQPGGAAKAPRRFGT